MKISTKGRYALRLMIDLAQHGHDQQGHEAYVTIKAISRRQDISGKYLEQIISMLSRAGFVKSARGPQGGYMLTRDPADYTVGMILRQIEGSLAPVTCLEDDVNRCPRCQACATLGLWQQLDQAISEVVDNVTLADLLQES